jgi:phosphoribosylpyrophosphate synthetase
LDSVTCIDPHSDVLEACIKGFRKESNISLFKWAIMEMFPYKEMPKGYFDRNHFEQNTILVSPDAGASKKIYKLAEQIGYKGDIITCSKERDENGNLTKTVVTIHGNGKCNKDFIIIDDICDGGSTFINIAKEIKNYFNHEDFDGYQPKIYLIVTHGIFSKGLIELTEYFDSIYCANSYSDDKGWPRMHQNFKQLNVF